MDNPDTGNIGHTRHRTKTIQRYWQHWAHKTQDEDNPEILTTLGTHDTGRKQTNKYTLEKTGVIKNEQSRDTGNIGCTRNRTKTNKQINLREN